MGTTTFQIHWYNMEEPEKLKISEKIKKIEPYDISIDITSIKKLYEPGWKIIYQGNKEVIKRKMEMNNGIVVSFLGNCNRGKTYFLQKLSGYNLEKEHQIQTKGLNMKFKDNIIYLDAPGINTPILLDNNVKSTKEEEIYDIIFCHYIVQKFLIENADILIYIVGIINCGELISLNKIKKFCENEKNIIVIHNLIKCESLEDIEKYKNEVLMEIISCELIEKKIPSFVENNINNINKIYFIEKDNPNIIHFIFANDDKKNKDLETINNSTLDFIRDVIAIKRKKRKNIIKNFLVTIKDLSCYALKNGITPKIEGYFIKCEEKDIILKEIKEENLDNIFFRKEYKPLYNFYRRGKYFVLEIQICSKIEDIDIIVEHYINKITDETLFIIKGKRRLMLRNESEYIENKRINFTHFKIEPKVRLSDFGIEKISEKEIHKELKYGILFYIYKILN